MADFPEPRRSNSVFFIEVDRVKPNPFQPRTGFDESRLTELAESIRQYGVLQPLVVTRKEVETPSGGVAVEYELIAGERRLRASRLAGLREVPALIREEPIEKIKLELALVENVQREDLNPFDRAVAFDRLCSEFGLTHKEIGSRIGKSREYVANSVRLLALPEEARNAVREGKITESHARYLLTLQNNPQEQRILLDDIIIKGLNVRDVGRISKEIISKDEKPDNRALSDPETKTMEEKLAATLGARVYISKNNAGGRVSLEFFSPEEMNSFLESLSGKRASADDGTSEIPEEMSEVRLASSEEEFTI